MPTRFFTDERRGSTPGISLTADLHELVSGSERETLGREVEARWRLVETAWDLNLPRAALTVTYDEDTGLLLPRSITRRQPITRARDAISGYQKGRCFYCFGPVALGDALEGPHVDHFLPHHLQRGGPLRGLDGVWNLVLACWRCNISKSGSPAAAEYLVRLHARNEFYIASAHPLRPTIIEQTGASEAARRSFLQAAYDTARELFPGALWSTPQVAPACF